MDQEDGLSDAQVRQKFLEIYGVASPPITPTTRKYLLKKITINMKNGGQPTSRVEEDEGDYDDEPDVAPHPPTRIPKRLGRSALAAMYQPNEPQTTRSASPGRNAKSPADDVPVPRQKSPSRKSTGRLPDLVDNNEDDENTRPTRKVTPARRAQEVQSPLASNVRGQSPSRPASGNFADSNLFQARKSIDRSPLQSVGSFSSTFQSPMSNIGNDTFRSRLAGTDNTQYQSDFVKRLSQTTRKAHLVDDDDRISDDDDVIGSPVKIVTGRSGGYHVESGKSSGVFPIALFFTFLVPFTVLVGAFALFYNSPKAEIDHNLRFPICQGSSIDIAGVTCIEELHRKAVESVYSAFAEGLTDIRLGAPCVTSHNQPIFIDNISVKEMIITVDDKISMHVANLELQNMKVLMDANPFLGLRSKSDGIQLVKGPDTFMCFLWSKMVLLAEWIIRIVVTSTLALMLFFGVKWQLARQVRRREEVMTAVGKVIDLVSSRKFVTIDQAGKELTSCGFPLDIVNDAVNKALEDSRLRLENRSNTKGIMWVGGGTLGSSDGEWTNDTDANDAGTYFLPPSCCLKIRGMFSPANKIMSNEDVTKIVDAILERSIGNRIVHVVVDRRRSADGIVYLRGLMKADASGVFRRLNNTFYNGRPVTVKFVRDERYEEKFPESPSYTRPLRPTPQPN